MLKDSLEVFITELGKTMKNVSIGFMKKSAYFTILTTAAHSTQLLDECRDILALDLDRKISQKS